MKRYAEDQELFYDHFTTYFAKLQENGHQELYDVTGERFFFFVIETKICYD